MSFFIAQQSGGCCDCGDIEAWRTTLNCPYHPHSPEAADYLSQFTLKTIQATPRVTPKVIAGQEVPPVRDYPTRATIPPELHESMSRTVGYALDYVLDTLDFSPDETNAPSTEADLRGQISGDPMQLKDLYCIVLWNDDKHSFEEVIQLLHDTTNRTREEAADIADRIDEQGREVVEMNTNVTRLLELGQTLSQIDIGITIRRAYDTFREQVSAVIIEWLLDLSRSRIGNDTITLCEVIASELLLPRKPNSPVIFEDIGKQLTEIQDPSRLDWFFVYHTKLWKKPRLNLKEIYAALLNLSHEHKLAIGE